MNVSQDRPFYAGGLMKLSDFRLQRAEIDDNWDAFVDASPQGTVFSLGRYMAPLRQKPGVWYCLKKSEIKAAIAVMETADGRSCFRHRLVIYNGIMFAPADPKQSIAQIHSDQFRTACFAVQALAEQYERVAVTTAPSFSDIRPFLWHNYGTDGPNFRADVRFTSFLPLDEPMAKPNLKKSSIYSAATKSRRQEIRYALEKDVVTREEFDPEMFFDFYRRTMERQDITVPDEELSELDDLIRHLHQCGGVRMYVAYTAEGTPGSTAIFALDGKRAYYFYGANDPALRSAHTGTKVLWDAFGFLSEAGFWEVDLEGVNSPERGYFKLSFGGNIVPYYRLVL